MTRPTLLALALFLPHKTASLDGTACLQGACFSQLPNLCGSGASLPSAKHATALAALCADAASAGDYPYLWDYDPANTTAATFDGYFKHAQSSTPTGFARALIEAEFAAAAAEESDLISCRRPDDHNRAPPSS